MSATTSGSIKKKGGGILSVLAANQPKNADMDEIPAETTLKGQRPLKGHKPLTGGRPLRAVGPLTDRGPVKARGKQLIDESLAGSANSKWSSDGKHKQNVTLKSKSQDRLTDLESWLSKMRNRGALPKNGDKIGISLATMVGLAALDRLRREDEAQAIELALEVMTE